MCHARLRGAGDGSTRWRRLGSPFARRIVTWTGNDQRCADASCAGRWRAWQLLRPGALRGPAHERRSAKESCPSSFTRSRGRRSTPQNDFPLIRLHLDSGDIINRRKRSESRGRRKDGRFSARTLRCTRQAHGLAGVEVADVALDVARNRRGLKRRPATGGGREHPATVASVMLASKAWRLMARGPARALTP